MGCDKIEGAWIKKGHARKEQIESLNEEEELDAQATPKKHHEST